MHSLLSNHFKDVRVFKLNCLPLFAKIIAFPKLIKLNFSIKDIFCSESKPLGTSMYDHIFHFFYFQVEQFLFLLHKNKRMRFPSVWTCYHVTVYVCSKTTTKTNTKLMDVPGFRPKTSVQLH